MLAGASLIEHGFADHASPRTGDSEGARTSTHALTVVGMPKTLFVCSQCGHESPKWHGRCPGCGEWNTLVEEKTAAARPSARSIRAAKPVPLREVEAAHVARIGTGIAELDRVLGGGLVPGSLVLIGGAPGIGKSTLTLAALANISAASSNVLY